MINLLKVLCISSLVTLGFTACGSDSNNKPASTFFAVQNPGVLDKAKAKELITRNDDNDLNMNLLDFVPLGAVVPKENQSGIIAVERGSTKEEEVYCPVKITRGATEDSDFDGMAGDYAGEKTCGIEAAPKSRGFHKGFLKEYIRLEKVDYVDADDLDPWSGVQGDTITRERVVFADAVADGLKADPWKKSGVPLYKGYESTEENKLNLEKIGVARKDEADQPDEEKDQLAHYRLRLESTTTVDNLDGKLASTGKFLQAKIRPYDDRPITRRGTIEGLNGQVYYKGAQETFLFDVSASDLVYDLRPNASNEDSAKPSNLAAASGDYKGGRIDLKDQKGNVLSIVYENYERRYLFNQEDITQEVLKEKFEKAKKEREAMKGREINRALALKRGENVGDDEPTAAEKAQEEKEKKMAETLAGRSIYALRLKNTDSYIRLDSSRYSPSNQYALDDINNESFIQLNINDVKPNGVGFQQYSPDISNYLVRDYQLPIMAIVFSPNSLTPFVLLFNTQTNSFEHYDMLTEEMFDKFQTELAEKQRAADEAVRRAEEAKAKAEAEAAKAKAEAEKAKADAAAKATDAGAKPEKAKDPSTTTGG